MVIKAGLAQGRHNGKPTPQLVALYRVLQESFKKSGYVSRRNRPLESQNVRNSGPAVALLKAFAGADNVFEHNPLSDCFR